MNEREELAARLRVLLAEELTREVSMFGGRAFMVDEKMVACAMKNGDLLIRVAADDHEALLRQPGAEQAEMGAGREMGPGWIVLRADAVSADEQLEPWLERALEYNRTVIGRGG